MIEQRIKSIQGRLQELAKDMPGPAPVLIAVSKQQPDDRIDAALAAGQRQFGENRVQEALLRWGPRRAAFPDLKLHLIGPLQTNKVAEAVALFDVIHTVDRVKLVEALALEMKRQHKNIPVFLQVNIGEEPQKSGVLPKDLPDVLDAARAADLTVLGLMCIPPVDGPAALYFALLHKLADRYDLSHLSMGMSDDFEQAISLGATHVRIGSGVFGPRPGTARAAQEDAEIDDDPTASQL